MGVRDSVLPALREDIGSGDVSAALLPADLMVDACIISRQPMLLCGQPWVDSVFEEINPDITLNWLVNDGDWLDGPATLCRIYGLAKDILTAERTALNFLQTLSGTATQTKRYVDKIRHTKTQLLDTRKTLPCLRLAQKYAVFCGGGTNHRLGLYDAFLIKENHILACGSLTNAIQKARDFGRKLLVEVEVETIAELQEAFLASPDRILLDNFSLEMLREAVALNKPYHCALEASGGVDLTTIASVAETGVDYISVGAITKSVEAIDLSLLLRDIS